MTEADRVTRVVHGLQPLVQIKGQVIPRYNILDRMQALRIPGLSVAVSNRGRVEWARGFGLADVPTGRTVTPDTLFLAGSVSKPVSALRVHQLAEAGIVDMDANVNDYLTSWQLPDNEFTESEKVTLRRILNHTAGLTVWGFPGYPRTDVIPTTVEVLDGKGNTPPVRVFKKPGESWLYSGGGYTIMQLLVSDVERTHFASIMRKHILDPLGMTGSTFENPLPDKYHAGAATGYHTNGDEVEGKWVVYPEMAAAGLWTTPSELIRYAIEVQGIAQNQVDGIVRRETVANMLTAGMNGSGLGPVIGEHTFGHDGGDQGFVTKLVAWRELPIAAVIMVNTENTQIIDELMLSIAAEYSLPGFEPITKSVIDMSKADRRPFTGTYSIPDRGEIEVRLSDDGLEVPPGLYPSAVHLLPESPTTFFETTHGTTITFTYAGGEIAGFESPGMSGTKVP